MMNTSGQLHTIPADEALGIIERWMEENDL